MAIAYAALLNHFEIKHDLHKYKGNYKPKTKRVIPTEEEIDDYYEHHCKSPQWKWIYGIIACYGIRPSEIWHLDMSLMCDIFHLPAAVESALVNDWQVVDPKADH